MSAENYQLKWNSHVTNLNSSISSLYKNDKYADVLLFTCNSEEGYSGIPAHKLILGTCSHYFSSIFDNNPMPINSMIYIVLPAELNRRAVYTLIQYMYTGEATVSNDILNEVLKGGEILKIRGLCKVHPSAINESYNSKPTEPAHYQNHQTTSYQSNYRIIENGSCSGGATKSNKTTPRSSIEKKTSLPEIRSASHHHILTQQESPVIVMTSLTPNTSSQNYAQQQQQQQQSNTSNNQQQSTTIIVKKDMAIDPGDNSNIPIEHYGLVSLQIAAAVKKAQQNMSTLKKTTSSPIMMDNSRHDFFQNDDILRYESPTSPTAFKIFTGEHHQEDEAIARYTEKKKRIAQNHKLIPSSSSRSNKVLKLEAGQQFSARLQQHPARQKSQQHADALSFLTIKEEPLEWAEFDTNGITGQSNSIDGINMDSTTEIITVKPETIDTNDNSLESNLEEKIYSPLTCEICNEVFQVPGAWVRHIATHSELTATQNIPKKRRRIDEDEDAENINVLTCDLCDNINFATPGDWVRHVQSTHTETELAMSNNSILKKKTKQPKESPTEKECSVCHKSFPSYASMLIHKRTHTVGERPFNCSIGNCNKGFNVKSNLLRHMRTLHNQLSSSLNDNRDESDENSLD